MNIPISQLRTSLLSKTGARALTNIPNFYSIIQETCMMMKANVSLPSSIRKSPFLASLYETPWLYQLPPDFSPEGLISIAQRDYLNNIPLIRNNTYASEFERQIGNYFGTGLVNTQTLNGIEYMNMSDSLYNQMTVVDTCADPTNGTFMPLGAATNVAFNYSQFFSGNASIGFKGNVGVLPFGIYKNNFATVVSTTDMTYMLMYAFFPQYIESVSVRFGTDASNYYEVTFGTDWQGNRFTTGWNTLLVTLANKVLVGTVADDNINYFAFVINDEITETPTSSFLLDSVVMSLGYAYDLTYYSDSIILDKWGSRKLFCLPDADTDQIMLNSAEYPLFLQQFSTITAIDIFPDSGVKIFNATKPSLEQMYENFNMLYPSQKILRSQNY